MEKAWGMPEGSLPDWYGQTLTEQMWATGETVKAIVSLKPGAALEPADLIAYCKERMAASRPEPGPLT